MPTQYELDYSILVSNILQFGEQRSGRNGGTKALFGETLTIEMDSISEFPLLNGRRLYHKGVFGEFAAFLRGPKSLADFEKFGCNYWKQWAKPDGTIDVDYGNQWINFNGVNQLIRLVDGIISSPHGRRHIVNSWRPDRLTKVDLPSCHFLYQWFVREDGYIDMIWYQRSVDVMVGLPSDVILAALFNICLVEELNGRMGKGTYRPWRLIFMLGDCHIYAEHEENAREYLRRVPHTCSEYPNYVVKRHVPFMLTGKSLAFEPACIEIFDYNPDAPLAFEVKA